MPTKKKSQAKKVNASKDDVVKEVEAIGTEIKNKVLALKKKFDRLDDQTKNKVYGSIAGAAAIMMAMHEMKKMGKK